MKMKGLRNDECGVAIALITFFITIVAVALCWICMNELVLHAGNWASNFPPANFGITLTILITMWRMTPVALLFCAVAYVLLKGHRSSSQYGG